MNLGDELSELKAQRSAGRIGPVEYYQSLARLTDVSPDAIPDPYEFILTSIRRIEALLEDRLGASGVGLDQKVESRADRIPPDLRSELLAIAALQTAISRGETTGSVEISGLQSRCAHALVRTLRLAEAASPQDPSIRIKAFLPAWARRGVVRKVRHSQRPILPGRRLLEYVALMDIDGRLEMVTSGSPLQIECGDWVVVAGRADHEPNLCCNESRPSGNKRKSYQAVPLVLAAAGALAALAGGAMVCLALSGAAHSHWDLLVIGRCAALVLAGVLTSWIGLWFATIMGQVARMARAFDEVLKLPSPVHESTPSEHGNGERRSV
jgi:hypothetical protein